MKLNLKLILYLLFICLVANISAASDLLLGKEKAAAVCSACHGLDGQAASGGNSPLIPNITAQQKDYLIAKLKDYKSGKINHPQMSLIAQMLTEEDIKNVSEWYSNIKIVIELPK
tara:strand:- start:464 stop:808 length:345 start_codon:yes stop_codon:yes gene_type:complete